MENNFLPHFINETIYVIKEDIQSTQYSSRITQDTSPETHESEKLVQKEDIIVSPPEISTEQKSSPKFKGNNQRKTIIIVDYVDHEYISPEDEGFLSKILLAVKINITEVAILNLNLNPLFDYQDLLQFKADHILYFGDNKILPAHFSYYNLQSVSNKQILMSPTLLNISKDTEQKKQLWEALKKMF